MSRNDLPNEKAPNFNARLRETLMTYLGKSGDPLDRGITLRDLLDSNLADIANINSARNGGTLPLLPGSAVGTGNATEPDLTPPPTPTGFKATSGIATIIVETDTPIYTQGHGHFRTHVYGKVRSTGDTAPTFADAAEITQFAGSVGTVTSNPATTWHLWAKWESQDGVLSASPAGGTNGLVVTTGQDVKALLDALTGQLTEQQLYKDLGDRINLIDGPLTMAGSVAAKIYAEAQARLAADTTLGSSITALQTTDATQATAITTLQTRASTSESNIITLQNTTASQATTITSLTTRTSTAESNITSLQTTTASQATSISSLNTTVGSHTSSITNLQTTTGNQATSITQLSSSISAVSLGLAFDQWVLNGQSIVTVSDGKVGTTALRLSGIAGAYPNQGNFVAINAGKTYRVKFWARPSSNASGLLYFSLRQFTAANASNGGPSNGGRSPYKPSGQSRAGHIATYGDTWGEYNYTWTSADWQSGVKFVQPEFLDNYSGGTGYWEVQGFSFVDATDVNDVSVSLQTEATTRANADGTLFAQYTVKIDNNGYVTGFGLASTAVNGTPYSTFGVRADSFYIASPSGPGIAPAMPFIVRTTATTINGVTVPVGVYITDAFIQNGTITNAKIGNAAIDSAKIADAAISTAKIGDAQITNAKIADATITRAKIASLSVGTADIVDAAISSAKIADAAIISAKIGDAAITSAKIGDAAITTAKIADASITDAKIVSLSANKISVSTLSALSADLGTVTAGTIKFSVDVNNYLIIDGPNQRIDVYSAGVLRVRLGKL